MTVEKQIRAFVEGKNFLEGNNNHVMYRDKYNIFMYYSTTIAAKQGNTLYILDKKISVSTTRRQNTLEYYAQMNNMRVEYISYDEMKKYKW